MILLVISIVLNGGAWAKEGAKKNKAVFKLVEAFSQRMLPGKQGGVPKTDLHFILIWQDNAQPTDGFYWKEGDKWQQCIAAKAHKAVHGQMLRAGFEYSQERAGLAGVKNGDTVILTPKHGSGSTVPEILQKKKGNLVVYRMHDGSWFPVPVMKMVQKRDIALP